MSLQRRNFLYSGLKIPFVVQAKVDLDHITLRTWKLSADANVKGQLLADDIVSESVNQHALPFVIDNDPFDLKKSGRDVWIPASAIKGNHEIGKRTSNLFLKPVSQIGFRIDPTLLGSGAWSDYAIWSFNITQNGNLDLPFNRYILTKESRAHARFANLAEPSPILLIYVPIAEDSFERCSFILQYNSDLGCIHNFNSVRHIPRASLEWQSLTHKQQFGVKGILPILRLQGPDALRAGSTEEYSVHVINADTEDLILDYTPRLYLEVDSGYMPKRQVLTSAGTASFSLSALGLVPGDQIKLKAGWRNYPGAAEKIITVV